MKFVLITLAFIATFNLSHSNACSAFQAQGQNALYFAKSFDWHDGTGMALINRRGLTKTALLQENSNFSPKVWSSKYSSITFNLFGKEFPMGGMNENALVVEILWLTGTSYPVNSRLPAINQSQWIQYILDTSKNVDEAIKNAEMVNIVPFVHADVHYLVCDSQKKCAVFEFLNKKMLVHKSVNNELVRALTNTDFNSSATALKSFQGFGGNKPIPQADYNSVSRFAILSDIQKKSTQVVKTDLDMFAALARVRNNSTTKWNIVYDQTNLKVNFSTNLNGGLVNRTQLAFDNKNLDCKTEAKFLDMNNRSSQQLKEYTKDSARDVLMSNHLYKSKPILLEVALSYPSLNTRCVNF